MQVRAEASHGLFPSKEFFPLVWFGFQIFQQLGLHLLQLQTHTWLQAKTVIQGKMEMQNVWTLPQN